MAIGDVFSSIDAEIARLAQARALRGRRFSSHQNANEGRTATQSGYHHRKTLTTEQNAGSLA
jgi:hypothetical protein